MMNFSFAGCGFLGIYHVGVAACLRKYAPTLPNKTTGASAGALAAACLLCDAPLGVITSSVLKTAAEARKRLLGPFSPTFNVEKLLREGLLTVLPEDAHERVNGRLFVSVTRVCDGKNILLSHFETREELIQALLCSAFIPVFSGWAALSINGIRYVDGGFSDNLPQLNSHTVTVSPFCGEADICPKDNTAGLVTISLANTSIELSKENLYRFARILFPPPPEILSKMCQQGFNDTLDFLQRSNLINCTRCLAIQSTFIHEQPSSRKEFISFLDEDNCKDCCQQREEAILDTLPETVGSILKEAVDSANRGVMNWVFKHRSMKLVSILSLPYVIPIEIAIAICAKFISSAPSTSDLKRLGYRLVQFIRAVIRLGMERFSAPHMHHHHKEPKFSCQLAITQFTGDMDTYGAYSKQNFDVSMHTDEMHDSLQVPREALILESEALSQLALKCRSRAPSRVASRAVSRAVSRHPSTEDLTPELHVLSDDTFEHILNVTSQHEALMAYYYMDDNNEVKVTEIFDMTEADIQEVTQCMPPANQPDLLSPYAVHAQLQSYESNSQDYDHK